MVLHSLNIEFLNPLYQPRGAYMHMLQRSHFFFFLASLLLPVGVGTAAASSLPEWGNGVVKIDVTRNDGKKELGSGVLIAPERLLTNCHVLRNASQIKASQGKESWPASVEMGDSYLDLCLLKLPGHPGKPPRIAEPDATRVGQSVYAAGYSGGTFSVNKGQIKGLYTCPCGGGEVIQTSAEFDPGASGGGLFNAEGELVGILTFKSHEGGIFHFAIPIGWMKEMSALPASGIPDQWPFWENPFRNSGYFLAACDLSAHKKWRDLSRLTREWVREEPDNPEAWMASGRANLGLKHPREAAGDFQKALKLDPTHGEALWELQQLEQELGGSLIGN
jgi:tetratricopeptide (TPR) repeat protein